MGVPDDRTPLLGTSYAGRALSGYGGAAAVQPPGEGRFGRLFRRQSEASSRSRSSRRPALERRITPEEEDYDVNNPPSAPSSPKLGPDLHYGDVMLASDEMERGRSADQKRPGDALIDIDHDGERRCSS